uniref:Ribosomal protein n=1 Tax=Ananas comosus var. bracteatus TaxID=296719 RepID=A0A6V7QJC0_ANACO|nr:unnamed protein product [Ananas comosus var. bracteatus]
MAHLVRLRRLLLRPSYPQISRTFSSSSSSSAPIKPVSYPVKPEDPSSPNEDDDAAAASTSTAPSPRLLLGLPRGGLRAPNPGHGRARTRGQARRGRGGGGEGGEEEPLQREARRIQSDARVRSFFGFQEEEEKAPYPTLIRPEKKPQKAPMDLMEAIREVKANAKRNFIETLEAHVVLGVDPRRGDQMVRGALTLPHGTGKTVRVAVFAEGVAADEARAAGADVVGGDELIEEIRTGGGKLNFDKCIATPMYMPRLSKIARILGPRGLMPNPKLGSVTSDVSGAVKQAKCGRIDFKIDKTAIVHAGLGKVNFSEEYLRENIGAFVHALLLAKPVGLKKTSKYAGYVKNFTLCSTMGPGFPVSIQSLSVAADHYNTLQVK